MSARRHPATIGAMDTLTPTNPGKHERRLAYVVNEDDDLVQVFLPKSDHCEVVIALLDEHGRPKTVARWDPDSGRVHAPGS
jgi:hypothetical protein